MGLRETFSRFQSVFPIKNAAPPHSIGCVLCLTNSKRKGVFLTWLMMLPQVSGHWPASTESRALGSGCVNRAIVSHAPVPSTKLQSFTPATHISFRHRTMSPPQSASISFLACEMAVSLRSDGTPNLSSVIPSENASNKNVGVSPVARSSNDDFSEFFRPNNPPSMPPPV